MSNLFKSKFLLGVMVITVLAVGALAFTANTSTAAASACEITSTLRVGSTGAQVSCLQTLVGVTADGHFGPMTKAAVMTWQTSKGLVADGVFGAKSRAVYNVGGEVGESGCPAGALFNPTTGASCTASTVPGCVAGALFSSTTGASCTGGTSFPAGCTSAVGFSSTTGVACSAAPAVSSTGEGSVTVTYDATPADNLAVNKGETKDVFALKVKATGSDMKVSRLWLDLSARIWLSASEMSLWDGSTQVGVVALSTSTVSEISTGAQWEVQFNNLNVTVPVGTTKILTVKVTRPTLTSANDSVPLLTSSTLRATDATGFSNTYNLTGRTINLTSNSSAITGTLTATLSGTSPLAQSISGLSTTAGTLTAVKLMDFDLKATDGPINVSAISGTDASTGTPEQDMASLELRDGSNVLSSVTVTSADTFAFNTLNIDIPAGTTKTLSIYAKANHVAGSYVVAGDGVNAVVTAVTATTNGFATPIALTPTVTGNIQYLYQYAPTITLGATTATTTNTSGSISADFSLAFVVTAPAGHDIWVHQTVAASGSNVVVEKTVSGSGGTIADTMTASTTSGTDGATYYVVLAGQSRTFTVYSHVPAGVGSGYTGVKLSKVYWALADAGTGAQAQIWGLGDFHTASVYVTNP